MSEPVEERDLAQYIPIGRAVTCPAEITDADDGIHHRAVTLCRARRGVKRRLTKRVPINAAIVSLLELVGDKKIGIIARIIRIGSDDYFIDLINPVGPESPLPLLCEQTRLYYHILDHKGKLARRLLCENRPDCWQHIRDNMVPFGGTEEEFAAARKAFLMKEADPEKRYKTFEAHHGGAPSIHTFD